MFKSARWRTEKNKVKAVFKLHFHATQLAQVRGDGLMISLVAADVGKPTVKLEKATIRDGSCYWENPVSETVTFFREPKSGKIREKIYYFVVSTGSSKADLVGEVSIDFASYAESTKLSSVSLPLKNAKSDAVLHVSIQRLQENVDQREDEETETTKNHSVERSLRTQLPVDDTNGSIKKDSSEDGPFNKTISHITEVNGNNHRASSGSDLTISSSESISGLDTPREFRVKNNNVHLDPTSFLSSPKLVPQKSTSNVSTTIHEEQQRSQWEWLGGSAPEASTDDSSTSPDDALLGEKSQEALDNVIEKLKTELSSLSRHAEMLELELQTLRKQIVKEGKKGQDLFKEVVSLKDERNALKEECEKLKAFKSKSKFEGGDPRALLEELRQEINYEKDLNANLRIQLQKTQESNSELILAVRDLDEMLEQKDREIFKLSNGSRTGENGGGLRETNSKLETDDDDDDDEEQKALEELVKEHSDEKEAHMLEEKITDLYSDLAIYKRDKDELEVQMEHLALDYEILKQENHELLYKLEQSQVQEQLKLQYECSSSFATVNELEIQIENLESELSKQATEFSDSLATITQLETHIKELEDDLEKQAQGFEADLEILTRAKVEQEQRAITAEDDLRKMRSKNVNTAERLQEEFRRLSMQMTSTFEANEKMATKALTEAGELRLQKNHLEELLQVAKEELEIVRDHYEAKLHELSSQISIKVTQIELMELEIEAKSKQLEQGKKNGEETRRVLSHDILMLRAEIETLKTENNILSDEREQMKASMKETEMLLQRGNAERSEMESVIALLRKEADKSMEELNVLKSLKDEKELIIRNLQLELRSLKSECNKLERSLVENEFEKEKLRKEVLQLKGNVKKKEDALNNLEKKLKDNNSRSTVLDGTKTTSRNNKSAAVTRGPKEIANLKDKLKLLEGQIKLKEAALETSTNSFLEKEKDLQNKIEELERRLEELNENSAQYEFQKVAKDSKNITVNSIPEEVKITAESNNEISSEKAMEASALNARDERNLDELLNEMALLRERNKSMEDELKEMQERYSEISLKFAEVEGERQQLVMKVRYLKNARKS